MPNGWFHPIDDDQPLECNLFDRQLILTPNETTIFFDTELSTKRLQPISHQAMTVEVFGSGAHGALMTVMAIQCGETVARC